MKSTCLDNGPWSVVFTLSLGAMLAATSGCAAGDIDQQGDDNEISASGEEDVAEATSPIYWSVNGHNYWFRAEPVAWTTARQSCDSSNGWYLVTVNSASEQAWLFEQIYWEQNYGTWWIGYNDRAKEGVWEWAAGKTTFNHWQPGQPDNAGGQDCAVIHPSNGKWYDMSCGSQRFYICERNW
jgi:hypothetical protein